MRFKCDNSRTALGKHSIRVNNCYYTIIISSKTGTWTKSGKEASLLGCQDFAFLLPTVPLVLRYE